MSAFPRLGGYGHRRDTENLPDHHGRQPGQGSAKGELRLRGNPDQILDPREPNTSYMIKEYIPDLSTFSPEPSDIAPGSGPWPLLAPAGALLRPALVGEGAKGLEAAGAVDAAVREEKSAK